jgi:hypothetical protein
MLTDSDNYKLQDLFLLDSVFSIHISQDKDQFINLWKAPAGHYALYRSGSIPILGYREINIELSNISEKRLKKKLLRLQNIAFCPLFLTNLASLDKLEERGIDWNHRSEEITLKRDLIRHT